MGKYKTDNHKLQLFRMLFCLVAMMTVAFIALSCNIPSVKADTAITNGYSAKESLSPESIVSDLPNNTNQIELANLANQMNMIGIVQANNNSEVSLSSGTNQYQVATSGISQVLVTNINGNISPGNEVTISPINGVGMLATSNAEVVGTAQSAFPNQSATTESVKINGRGQTVKIGTISVLISVSYYNKQPSKTIIPAALQNLANSVVGKQVKALPIILSAVIFIITLIVVVSIIYSLIHSSVISVGRNPMAQSAVYRNVMQLSALVVVIIGVALFAIFMILTRLN